MSKALRLLIALFALLIACGNPAPTVAPPTVARVTSPTPTSEVAIATALPSAAATVSPPPTLLPTPDLSQRSIPDLVQDIVAGPNLLHAVTATEQALARGGIATADLEEVLVPAVAPKASFVASPSETFALALEARQRAIVGRMTVAELAQMMSDFGWQFPADSKPADQLIQFFSVWTTEAQKEPSDPQNFNALFIYEMAKQQAPPVDLAADTAKPTEVRLSLLELELFAAAFDRGVQTTVQAPTKDWVTRLLEPLVPTAHAQIGLNPCEDLNKTYGKLGGPIIGVGYKEGFKKGLIEILKDIKYLQNELEKKILSKSMSSLGIILKLWKLAALYNSTLLAVTIDGDNPMHKPVEGERRLVRFVALAQLSDDEAQLQRQQLSARDKKSRDTFFKCLKNLGFPVPTLESIADLMDKWSVEWKLVAGSPEHAFISLDANDFYLAGQQQVRLKRTGQYTAQGELFVDIRPEKEADHPSPIEQSANVTVRAELETSEPPTFSTFFNAAKGGTDPFALASALTDVLSGWFQEIKQPKAYATLKVTYHEPVSFVLDFASQIHLNGPKGYTFDSHLQASVPLQYDVASKTWKGEAPLEYVSFSGGISCIRMKPQTGGIFKVVSLEIPLTPVASGADPGVSLVYSWAAKRPSELQYYSNCPGKPPPPRSTNEWADIYSVIRSTKGDPQHEVKNWEYLASGDHPIYARKVYAGAVNITPFGIADEKTVFELKRISTK